MPLRGSDPQLPVPCRDPSPFLGYPPLKRLTNEFAGNDFRRADLVDCEFAGGIDVTRQLWPSDPDYIVITDVRATMRRVELAIRALDDPDQQLAAREAIELRFRHAADSHQTTQLVRISWLQEGCDDPTARALALALTAPQG